MSRVGTASEEESALLLRCPAAEPVVGACREQLDPAARVGAPAHVTLTYPFRPVAALTEADHDRLERLFAQHSPFTLTGERTAWFGDAVLFVALGDTRPVLALVDAVTAEFPDHPPYGGVFSEVVPHLTVGDAHDAEALREAEAAVEACLPFRQTVSRVELWSGPSPVSGRGRWRLVRGYPLG